MSTYAISGVCAAVAGLIVAADIRGADANNRECRQQQSARLPQRKRR
jgi:ribose/xylose/arabinose/galactoside ABC-type transport system permease subunit